MKIRFCGTITNLDDVSTTNVIRTLLRKEIRMHSIVESYKCLQCDLVIYLEEHLEQPYCPRCHKDTLVDASKKSIVKSKGTLKDYFDLNKVMDVRVYNALRGTKYNTPEALYHATDAELFCINRIGKKSKERIEQFKREYEADC